MKTLAEGRWPRALLVLLLAARRRRALAAARGPTAELNRAHAGVAWHVPGGIGTSAGRAGDPRRRRHSAEWFGQRGAPIRRVAGRVTVDGAPVADALVELGNGLSDAGVLPTATRAHRRRRPLRLRRAAAGELHVGREARWTTARRCARLDTRDPTVASDRIELRLGGCAARLFGQVSDTSGGPIRRCPVVLRAAAGRRLPSSATTAAPIDCACRPRSSGSTSAPRGTAPSTPASTPMNRPRATRLRARARGDDCRPGRARRRRQRRSHKRACAARRRTRPARFGAPGAAVTDEHGRFTIAGLAPGRHRLFAFAHRLAAAEPTEITVDAGTTSPEVVLRLRRRRAHQRHRRRRRAAGRRRACPGRRRGADWRRRLRGPASTRSRSRTAPSRSKPVPRGSVRLERQRLRCREPTALVVDCPELDGVRVRRAHARLDRRPRHAPGQAGGQGRDRRRPASSATSPCTVSDDDGALHRARPACPASIFVNAEEQAPGSSGSRRPIDARRRRAAHRRRHRRSSYAGGISGAVVEEDGTPASGVWVNFMALHKPDQGEALTGADGTFRLANARRQRRLSRRRPLRRRRAAPLRARRRRLSRRCSCRATQRRASPTSRASAIVMQREHLTITGTTVDGDGQPLSDVHVGRLPQPANAGEKFNTSVTERPERDLRHRRQLHHQRRRQRARSWCSARAGDGS